MLRKMIKGVKDAQASLLIKEVQTKTSFLGFFFLHLYWQWPKRLIIFGVDRSVQKQPLPYHARLTGV